MEKGNLNTLFNIKQGRMVMDQEKYIEGMKRFIEQRALASEEMTECRSLVW